MRIFPLFALLIASLAIPASAQTIQSDAPGTSDPSGLKRIEGAFIIGYDQSGFDDMKVPLSTVGYDGPEKSVTIEGPRTRVIYLVPGDRSPLEVIRNYEAELTTLGFETTFTCGGKDCGPASAMSQYLYPREGQLKTRGRITASVFSLPRDDQRYLLATNPETNRTVSIYVAFETFDHFPELHEKTIVLMDVIDGQPLTRRMEFVSAEKMALSLDADGRVSLYGIHFDHDSDALKPESDPTLEEIAKFLGAAPDLRVFVVGHTDMTGGYDYNIALSQRRAKAVVQALTARHGVAADRLDSAGVGPLAPVAENETEAGRALNRRVELVRR
ncbi:OmpA family protein [Rhodalgimonas zhirmunskyi]|uniref:OmpA family protein n=1 Tax=Rhodalgimonas zhirmunskyi TaxID=2964767 RepID=A0AAJ1UAI1_9RHOB|nr:OmpA family protein [Rhodoalgimonas zhirmunskyi]MDQ2092762.1 OmpA family protein [Rhodoalgimonas zhirmunskyi]